VTLEWDFTGSGFAYSGGGGGPPLCLAVLDLASDAGRSEKRGVRCEEWWSEDRGATIEERWSTHRQDAQDWTGWGPDRLDRQHRAEAVEPPHGEIGWSGLLVGPVRCAWLAGSGLLAISCRLGRRASSAPTTSCLRSEEPAASSQDHSRKMGP
jgi:hypothetical protein